MCSVGPCRSTHSGCSRCARSRRCAILRGDDQTVLLYGDESWGYATFIRTANGVAHTLRDDFGIAAGDRVAVLAQNSPAWCLAFWATVMNDAVLVGLNGWWKTDEILYGIEDSGAKVLVADRKRFERIADDLDGLPSLEAVLLTDCEPSDFPSLVDDKRLHRFEELTGSPTDTFPDVPISEDDHAVIFYTSGTTGRPKGAISTHRSMIANMQNTLSAPSPDRCCGDRVPLPSSDGQNVSLFTSPLFHVSGCHSGLVVGVIAGVKMIMPVGRFDPDEALRLIQDEGVTIWATVPTMVWRVCEHPDAPRLRHVDGHVGRLRWVAIRRGAAAQDPRHLPEREGDHQRLRADRDILRRHGQLRPRRDRQAGLGRPAGANSRAADRRPWRVHRSRSARRARSASAVPILMAGYWGKPEATAEAIDADGWLHTGDIGHLDDEGFLFITDRKKDMIIRGGENIYCVEIENRLVEHPAVADAAIIGVPHAELGEEVKAVVQIEPGETLTEDEVRAWVRETLAEFKVPAYVELRDETPAPQRQWQAPQERPAGRRRGQLRRDDVALRPAPARPRVRGKHRSDEKDDGRDLDDERQDGLGRRVHAGSQ